MAEKDVPELDLRGFVVGGFRSFHGEPQLVGPMGKVTVVAGPNNSGKSNILLATQMLEPLSRGAWNNLPSLDVPVVPEGEEPPPLVLGLVVPAMSTEQQVGIIERLSGNGALRPGADIWQVLQRILNHPSVTQTLDDGEELMVLRWTVADGALVRDPEQLRAVADDLSGQVENRLFGSLSSALVGRAGSLEGNIGEALSFWTRYISIPPVHLIPATRAINAGDAVSNDEAVQLPNTHGGGLPGFLERLQAPSAERHREDRKRFQKINDFIAGVLEEESVELTVPHDSRTVHVSLGDRVLPLENLGSGISQLVLMAATATAYDNCLLCIEEPEIHLHPVMLRKLIRYLHDETSNRYLITTHSAHLLDDPDVSVLHTEYLPTRGTTVTPAMTPGQRASISQRLGYRPSDLIQANCVIWVEGPSDRIYLNHWISSTCDRLVEGIHYSIMFYGGRLLAHLTGEEMPSLDASVDEFINLLQINRNMAIVIDSDRGAGNANLNATKTRVIDSFTREGRIAWVTDGREIENYIPLDVFAQAVKQTHPTSTPPKAPTRYSKRFAGLTKPDKVAVAQAAVAGQPVWGQLDLQARVGDLVAFILAANHLAAED